MSPSRLWVRWIFLRALALVYFTAFVSIWVQIHGLVGEQGILPFDEYLETIATRSDSPFAHLPTLLWWWPTDAGLTAVCALGVLCSLALVWGLATRAVLVLTWALYLSLVSVGQIFVGYQWDALLLETGLLAVFFAPSGWRPGLGLREPSPLATWLLRLLVFRLMFWSGLVKWFSGDPSWASFTALEYHYWTQPITPWTAWFAAWLPPFVHTVSCVAVAFIELLLPFAIFMGARGRRLALLGFGVLLFAITVTGFYGFFTPLAFALCLTLLDDDDLRALSPRRLRWLPQERLSCRGFERWAASPLLLIVLIMGWYRIAASEGRPPSGVSATVTRWAAPFHSVNRYGLFARMTTTRPEIELQGRMEGGEWESYVFRWKAGPLDRRGRWAIGHMPRLDWQMWFASLSSYEHNAWLLHFMTRLHQAEPDVLALLADDPFNGQKPTLVRALLYEYRFVSFDTWLAGEGWWVRERVGHYAPLITPTGWASPTN